MPALAAEAEATTTEAPVPMGAIAVGMANAEASPVAETGPPSVAGVASGPETETETGVAEAGTATTITGTVAVSTTVAARSSVGALGGAPTEVSGPSARSVPGRAPGIRCRSPRETRLRLRALAPARSQP